MEHGQTYVEHDVSYIQQMRWMQHLSAPRSSAYNVNFIVQFDSPADLDALTRSIEHLLRRHAILRTTYVQLAQGPVQRIWATPPQVIRVADVAGWSGDDLQSWLARQADEPFDLRSGPVLRANVLCRLGKPWRLQVVAHHIAMDFRSCEIFLRELGTLHDTVLTAGHALPPELPLTYAQYVREQRAWLESRQGTASRQFWRDTLAGELPVLALPLSRPYPAVPSYKGVAVVDTLSTAEITELRRISSAYRATPFMLMLTCLALWLRDTCSQDEMLIGIAASDREEAGTTDLLGDFVNTLPLRVNLSRQARLEQAVAHVRSRMLEVTSHSRVPFVSMLSELKTDRSRGASPAFQVLFAWNRPENLGAGQDRGLGIKLLEASSTGASGASHELSLMVIQESERLLLHWTFNTSIFEEATASKLAQDFSGYLRSILAGSQRNHRDVSWEQVRAWNDTTAEFPAHACMHELIDEQARRSPEHAAVILPGQTTLSYRELSQKADSLARLLQSRDVGPDVIVALYMHRCVEMVVAILAVMKAGGAYLPIDPDTPAARSRYMLEDARPPLLLTQGQLLDRVADFGVPLLVLDDPTFEWLPDTTPHSGVIQCAGPRNLAYVIYTSGSTGQPKGVQIEHEALVNRIWWMQQKYSLTAADRVLQKTPYVFDVSVWEFMWPLMAGATLVIAKPGGHHDPAYLAHLIQAQGISVLHFVPSMLHGMLDEPQWVRCNSVRLVFCSGEALSIGLQERFFATALSAQLHNLYGPTEAAIDVSFWACRTEPDASQVPIGRPISNIKLYILNPRGEIVPVGAEGELYIGGVGLARGYLNQPQLTTERFVANPFSDGFDRLYRTGDLARHRPDGNIEYLGRLDTQVKIRGFRIELSEIEAALLKCPGIERALADSIAGPRGQQVLVAYVAAVSGAALNTAMLGEQLSQVLPPYAVPSVIEQVAEFPITVNGKADRAKLRQMISYVPLVPYAAPNNLIEHTLAQIWQSVLGVERVGVDDNYFELGGDSILSLKIVARAKTAGIEFELDELIELRTVRKLAARCRTSAASADVEPLALAGAAPVPPSWVTRPQNVIDVYPLSALQAGMIYHAILSSSESVYHDVFRYRIQGRFDARCFEEAIATLTEEHEVLRTFFDLNADPEPVQCVLSHADCPLQVVDLRPLQPAEQAASLESWTHAQRLSSFDWKRAPLLRIFVHLLNDTQFELSVSFSHAILDGWSVAVLVTELLKRSNDRMHQRAITIKPHTAFRGYIEMERRALASAESLQFWRQYLQGIPQPFFADGRSSVSTGSARGALPDALATTTIQIDVDVALRLQRVASSLGLPHRSVILTAHVQALSLFFNTRDVVTGLVVNGRPEVEDAESLLGLFLNTLPLRFPMKDLPPRELVALIAAQERMIHPHRRLPLRAIQETAGSGTPFDAVFNYVQFYKYDELTGLDDCRITDQFVYEETNFPLVCNFVQESQSANLWLRLSYRTRWFDQARIAMLADSYQRILRQLGEESGLGIDSGRVHGALHPAALRDRFPEPAAVAEGIADKPLTGTGAADLCIHQIFEQQARSAPDARAVEYAGEWLSYGALDTRSSRLAGYLQARGVGPETLVGVCLPRGLDLIVAILGILKAGGAYVPLDPAYPTARLSYIARDAQLKLIVTLSSEATFVAAGSVERLCLDDAEIQHLLSNPSSTLAHDRGSDSSDLCYVIYTSGSTGLPKGVMVEHRNVTRLFETCRSLFEFGRQDVWTLFHSYSFDFSVWEIFGALLFGGRLVVVPDAVARSPRRFLDLLCVERVTILNQTPSAFYNLLGEMISSGAVLPSLRYLIFGGEALEPRKLQAWFSQHGFERTRVINMYGITETTVHVTFKRILAEDLATGISTIGTPLPDMAIHILDEALLPVPNGAQGEICVGGAGVARGYLGRIDLTAERFPPNPFRAGSRLYRSGDLARRGPNGELQYLGRADRQVKIRGFRIELGEVEAQIVACGGVTNAVVVAAADDSGPSRLVAYVVIPAERRVSGWQNDLRQRLLAVLPSYMVPAWLISIDAVPLTENGKVDVAGLPQPGPAQDPATYVAPRDSVEATLVRVYESVMHTSPIGVHDDYFAVGGDSIRVVQLVAKLQSLGYPLDGIDILRRPTIAKLAQFLEERGAANRAGRGRVPLELVVRQEGVGLEGLADCYAVTQLQRLMLQKHEEMGHGVYHPQHAFEVRGVDLDLEVLDGALNFQIARQPALRSNFRTMPDGLRVQCVHTAACTRIGFRDLSALSGAEQQQIFDAFVRDDLDRPIDTRGPPPLMRFQVFKRSDTLWNLLISSHHVIEDGWGFVEFVRSMMERYTSLMRGDVAQPAPQTLDLTATVDVFKERIALECEAAQLPEIRAVWERILADVETFDLPPPRSPASSTGTWTRKLSRDEVATLRLRAREHGCPPKVLFLFAYAQALSRLFHRDNVVVDVVASGRTNRLSDPMTALGLFWNFLPIPCRTGSRDGANAVRRLHELLLQAEEFSTYPVMDIAHRRGLESFTCAAFNYVHFHNSPGASAENFRLVHAHDRFHHRVKLAVVIEPDWSEAGLTLDFDPACLSEAQLAQFTDAFSTCLASAHD